jgi:hypothetical protein
MGRFDRRSSQKMKRRTGQRKKKERQARYAAEKRVQRQKPAKSAKGEKK